VLIGRDGRVRVADFGLAGLTDPGTAVSELDETEPDGELSDDASLTRTGVILGTPAFMAPEQHRGERADARADQYALCASLYYGLHGVRPFDAETIAALYRAKMHLRFSRPSDADRPHRLDAVLRRGLSPDPAKRFPSMPALIDALRPRARRRRGWLAATMIGLVGAGLAGAGAGDPGAMDCRGVAHEIADSWDEPRRDHLRAHLLEIGAGPAWTRIHPHIDAFVATWTASRTQVCESRSDAAVDARMQCLRDARTRLDATYDLLLQLEAEQAGDATDLVVALRRPTCEPDPGNDGARAQPADPATRAAVDDVRRRLAALQPRLDTLRVAADDPELTELLADAEATGFGPGIAEVLRGRAHLRSRTNDVEGGIADHERAHALAVEANDDLMAFDSALALFRAYGESLGYDAAADRWGAAAEAALLRIGDPIERRGRYEDVAGAVARTRGEVEAAVAHGREAVRALAQVEPPVPRLYASAASALGEALRQAGDPAGALAETHKALAILQRVLGSDHRLTIGTRYACALALFDLGRDEAGAAMLDESLSAAYRSLGPLHPWIAAMENEAGTQAMRWRDHEAARDHYERALVAAAAASGRQRDEYEEGIGLTLAQALAELGRHAEAAARLQTALEASGRVRDEGHPELVLIRCELGQQLYLAGQRDEGRARIDECRAQALAHDAGDVLAIADVKLAEIIVDEDPARARQLAQGARGRWLVDIPIGSVTRPLPGSAQARIRSIDAWLAAHP
jgi:tetratricopeptide (TPR) repeat protein